MCLSAGPVGCCGRAPPSCCGHPLERDDAAHVVGQILQADLGARPHDADGAHDPAPCRTLLRSEHMLDARADLALGAVRPCLCIRQRMVAAGTSMNAALEPASLELRRPIAAMPAGGRDPSATECHCARPDYNIDSGGGLSVGRNDRPRQKPINITTMN